MIGNRLRVWERTALVLFGVLFLLLGALVEIRSAFQRERKTDFGVYARAAWAVRVGHDLYRVEDDRGWHYCYPSPFAIFMTPLADPPEGETRAGFLPFAVSVAVWYAFSLGCVAFAVHRLAAAILPDEPHGTRRWWYARIVPVYVCIGGIGYTLARGQVNLLLVAMIAGMFAAVAAKHRFRAGIWLGAAIALKVIPAYLVLYFLLKRDTRAIAGVVASLIVSLGVIPTVLWGPQGAIDINRQLLAVVLQPGATGEGDQTRAKELTNATATDSQSFQAAIHNVLHPNLADRPKVASPETRLAHWAIGFALTALLVFAERRMPTLSDADSLVILGGLCAVMLHLTPVSHMHYYALGLPLVAGLWLRSLSLRPGSLGGDRSTRLALIAWGVVTALPLFPGEMFDAFRSFGIGTAATIGLLIFAACQLSTCKRTRISKLHPCETTSLRAA